MRSPLGASSILITSAPRSAIRRPTRGPAINWPSSRTRRSENNPSLIPDVLLLPIELTHSDDIARSFRSPAPSASAARLNGSVIDSVNEPSIGAQVAIDAVNPAVIQGHLVVIMGEAAGQAILRDFGSTIRGSVAGLQRRLPPFTLTPPWSGDRNHASADMLSAHELRHAAR